MRPRMAMMTGLMRTAPMVLRLDRSGATSIEYALIATFISIVVVGWATFVGQSISGFFMSVANGF
jgi:pilus assembly protein Flp/PilA